MISDHGLHRNKNHGIRDKLLVRRMKRRRDIDVVYPSDHDGYIISWTNIIA